MLDTSQLCFEGNFDAQVKHILGSVRLTCGEVVKLKRLFDDLQDSLQMIWPNCEVHPFGSIVTGLGIKTSDVDCFVALPYQVNDKNAVSLAKNRLRRHPMIFTELFAITTAKVPIVKFLHIPTNCYCDVNFKSPSGLRNSKLIAFLLLMDHRALPLAVLVKYWSKVHRFTGSNLMPNYALTMFVIFYLQQKKILPPVLKLQMNTEHVVVDSWNTSINIDYHHSIENNESLYDLLGGFFKYYTTFNFNDNIISPFLGYPINRRVFDNLESVPDDFNYYKHNLINKLCKPLRLETKMCVQDPFEHSRNCAVAIYPKLVEKVLAHFKFAAKSFDEKKSDDILEAILTQDPQTSSDLPAYKRHRIQNKVKKNIKGHYRHNNLRRQAVLNKANRGKR